MLVFFLCQQRQCIDYTRDLCDAQCRHAFISLCVEQICLSEAFKLKSSCTNCVSRGKLCTEHSFWASLDSTNKRGHEIGQIDWVSFAIGASLVAQMVKNHQSGRLRFDPWVRKIPWRREWLPAPGFLSGEAHRQRKLVGYCL